MRTRILTKVALGGIALLMFPGAKSKCGSDEANTTLTSPLQSVTLMLERADGRVDVSMHLIDSQRNRFISDAIEPTVRMPDGARVDLKPAGDGRYVASTVDDSAVKYVPNETYKMEFGLDASNRPEALEGDTFTALTDPPDDTVTATLAKAPEFAGDQGIIEWTPARRDAHFVISRDGRIVHRSLDFTTAEFDGSKWGRLGKKGRHAFNVDVFGEPGTYLISVCPIAYDANFDTTLSAELGALSGFAAGRCAADLIVEVNE